MIVIVCPLLWVLIHEKEKKQKDFEGITICLFHKSMI